MRTQPASVVGEPYSSRSLIYVLITPARNEAESIERTIKCVLIQTHRPARWVIVSDGSTDGTDEIALKYCAMHTWIRLVRIPDRKERHFAGKVDAFNAGYTSVKDMHFDLVGNLDADLSFDADYFEYLIRKFEDNPRLGIGGTPFLEGNKTYDFRFSSVEHVSGACQLFRRQCYDEIGGYIPIEGGGIDVVAVLTARMRGWQTRTFTEKVYVHHRKMGTAKSGIIMARFKDGQKDYVLGTHPVWIAFRAIYQMANRPLFIGGCALISGYYYSMIRRTQRPISSEVIRFRRMDQMRRLREFAIRMVKGGQ